MKVLFIALTLMSTAAFADHHEEGGKNIEEVKAKISANIDQKISALQAHKSCVQSASNHEALKSCRQSHKETMKKLHEENKGEREQWKAEKQARKEERQKNKKNKSN